MNHSVWSSNIEIKHYNRLQNDIRTEALVIGGGIAGILTAYHLNNAGVKTVLVEGNRILNGVTQNTTAKITSQHGLIYHTMIEKAGVEKAKMYLDANEMAIKKYKELSEKIDCDFTEKSAFIYSRSDKSVIEKEIISVNRLGFEAKFHQKMALPFDITGAIEFGNQAQFHPLKLLKALAKELTIYENTFVKKVEKNTAYTDFGKIQADHIIVATHFPFINIHGSYFLKMYQRRSYIIALKQAMDVEGMYLEDVEDGFSFRNYKDMLLIGGGGHKTGKPGGNFEILRNFASENFNDAKEVYAFSAQDCITLDKTPYIGNYSKCTKNLYVATGFNKWGMTSSMVSAILLTDLITGRKNPYEELFSPSRSMMQPQLLKNTFTAVTNLLNFSGKRCPHMGCSLSWNKAEHTWECPCHGSRFDKNGKLIDNPAKRNLKS